MKPEEKQALIELNRIQIACWEMIKSNEGQLSPHCAGLLETHKIALAALTAPASGLAELVPDAKPKPEPGTHASAFTHWHDGWNACRAEMLRNIEEAK